MSNRFSLVLTFNGDPIFYEYRGRKIYSQRDFDVTVGSNYYGSNGFSNSWAAVEMGENLKSVTELIMEVKTKEHLNRIWSNIKHDPDLENRQSYLDHHIKQTTKPNDYFSYKLIDNQYQLRNGTQVKKCLYEQRFSPTYYSFDGANFTPPIKDIWKDFDCLFQYSKNREVEEKYSDYQLVYNDFKEEIEESKELYQQIGRSKDITLKEKLKAVNSIINRHYFKGLRTICIDALTKAEYTNRFYNS